jgi:hypothetical protein
METKNKNNTPFKVEDVDWKELSGIGILKDELELTGELETLLSGERTAVIPLSLVLLGVDVVMDATLQLVRSGDSPLLEITGVRPVA